MSEENDEVECPRGRTDCEVLDYLRSTDGTSFFCCGLNDGSNRTVEGDEFTVCFKNDEVDEIGDWDSRDIITQIAVLSSALRVKADMDNNDEDES